MCQSLVAFAWQVAGTIAVVCLPFILLGALIAGDRGAVAGVALGTGTMALAWAFSRPVLLRVFRARPVDAGSHADLAAITARLADAAGIRRPLVAISALRTPNAFAAKTPGGGVVGVTAGLLDLLTTPELEAVLAHEVAHLTCRERAVATTASVIAALPGALATASGSDLFYDRAFTRAYIRSWGGRYLRPLRDGVALGATALAALIVRASVSRRAEIDADNGAMRLAATPEKFAPALRKIDALAGRIAAPVNPAIAHLLVIHPFSSRRLIRLFDTHPSLPARLAALAPVLDTPSVTATAPVEL